MSHEQRSYKKEDNSNNNQMERANKSARVM